MITSIPSPALRKAGVALRDASALLITAGAGMGVDSGLPDFRGTEGFWKAYPPLRKLGISFVEMVRAGKSGLVLPRRGASVGFLWTSLESGTPSSLRSSARSEYHEDLAAQYRSTRPHAGFKALLDMAVNKRDGFFVFTSNVDGQVRPLDVGYGTARLTQLLHQFQRAGFPEDRVVECHGSLMHLQCLHTTACTMPTAVRRVSEDARVVVDESTLRARADSIPKCLGDCGCCVSRPNVLMFGDSGFVDSRLREQEAGFQAWVNELRLKHSRLVVVECGAGQAVPTVRLTGEQLTRFLGGTLVRVNPRDFELPSDISGIALPWRSEQAVLELHRESLHLPLEAA